MTEVLDDYFKNDSLSAIDSKFEAQKIAFAPYAFQATMALRNLGVLDMLYRMKGSGATISEIAEDVDVSKYGIGVLLEFGLSMGLVKLKSGLEEPIYILAKIGYFILKDEMTRVNMDFINDICYAGAAKMESSIRNGKPEGLKSLGEWNTIYEGLSILPERQSKSWFAFDHYYSQNAFLEALPLVFHRPIKKIMDIGGNTANWALACADFSSDVEITIVDLPGQCGLARKNIDAAGLSGRIHTYPQNVLAEDALFPEGHDTVWMSQFLDCFGVNDIVNILRRAKNALGENGKVYIVEPFWDRQTHEIGAYCLINTSPYFTALANGTSKMYRASEFEKFADEAGLEVEEQVDGLGFGHTLMICKAK